jgi:hypothetical protein
MDALRSSFVFLTVKPLRVALEMTELNARQAQAGFARLSLASVQLSHFESRSNEGAFTLVKR